MTDKTDQPKAEDRLHPLLSNAEVLEIRAQARAQLEKERLVAAKKALLQEETERLRQEEGMVTGGVGDEMVDITIILPIFSDRIVVNQRAYFHSRTYRVPRHVANSLSETMWRGHRHQEEVEGHSMTQLYQNARGTVLSPVRGTVNAPRRFDA